jgi:hypothetical protein
VGTNSGLICWMSSDWCLFRVQADRIFFLGMSVSIYSFHIIPKLLNFEMYEVSLHGVSSVCRYIARSLISGFTFPSSPFVTPDGVCASGVA